MPAWRQTASVERLEDRRLLSVAANPSPLVFNSALPGTTGGGPGHVESLALTNIGSSAVSIPAGGISIVADPNAASEHAISSPGAFSVTNLSSIPASLAPGRSVNLALQFTASQTGAMFQSAILQVQTSDSTLSVALHGLSTSGQFGTSEPSLVQILRANDIPTVVGAGPGDSNYLNSQYPTVPDPSSTEVPMQRLVKAGDGPVTITPLAAFNASAQPTVRFGYYTPGDPTDLTELFTIGQSDAQTVNPTPLGATSFDPGSSTFSLYATYPGISTSTGQPDTHYSEDALNTLDPTHPRKFRFFPLENPDGSVVPNAYVVASEDYNSTAYNSFVNFVGIIRNVMPAPDAVNTPVLGLTNLDQLPSTNRLIFNRIQVPNSTYGDIVHDTNTLRINNSGDQTLRITGLTLSDTTNWELVNPPALPASVPPGGSLALTVKFIAQSAPTVPYNETNDSATINDNGLPSTLAGGVWNATLTISSNDPVTASRQVQLAGYWQHQSEHEEEAGAQTIINLLADYQTQIANTPVTEYPEGSTPVYYGQEAANAFLWQAADPNQPVSVQELAGEYSEGVNPAFTGYYTPGQSSHPTMLYRENADSSQCLLPPLSTSASPAAGTFKPSATFGWDLDGVFSQDSLNPQQYGAGHLLRAYPLRDQNGNVIPNAWLLLSKYAPTNGFKQNYDFNDIIDIAFNVRPLTQAPAPTDLQAVNSTGGVTVEWAPASDPSLTGYNVYRSSSAAGPYTQLTSAPVAQTTFIDASSGAGTVYYRVTAVDSAGESEATNASVTIGTVQQSDVLSSLDVNATPAGSTTVVTPGANYNVTAGGADIGGSAADGFRFLYEQVSGDFDVHVQVNSLAEVIPNTFAGITARQTLDAGSPMVFSGATAADGYRFNYRTAPGAVGSFNKYGAASYPKVWVRLQRQGDVFTGYYSSDGVNWVRTQQLTLVVPTSLYVGIAVASHSTTQATTAQLRSFALAGTVGTPPPALTPAQQVAADRAALKVARLGRTQDLRAARQQFQADLKAYRLARRALHRSPADPALQAAVAAELAVFRQDRLDIANTAAADSGDIKSLQKQLSMDLLTLRKSRHHKP